MLPEAAPSRSPLAQVPGAMHHARWGDASRAAPLSGSTRELVSMLFTLRDAPAVDLGDVVVPACGLPDDLLAGLAAVVGAEHVLTDHDSRVLRTRGKSTPDLLAVRAGDATDAPDAVVRPADHEQVQRLLAWASDHRVAVVPFGGGTSVVGGLAARRDGLAGVVSLDLGRLDRLVEVDEESMTAVLEAGVRGPDAERLLGAHGLTLGHFPQSFEHASIGGFAATRSSGQASSGYGRFDSLVVGLCVATPAGTWRLGSAPATAAGPDLRELVLGSEGAFGVITSVRVRVRRRPAVTRYEGWRLPDLPSGLAALRTLAQDGVAPTVLRLSDEAETAVNLATPDAVGAQDGPATEGGCLVLAGYEGSEERVATTASAACAVLERLGGTALGPGPGQAWSAGRFDGPYLRDSLLDAGVLVETLETATFWSRLPQTYAEVKAALERTLGADGAPVLVLCHVSHVYETGASLYFTVVAQPPVPQGPGDPTLVEQWLAAKTAATDAMVRTGATITHHHAVGRDHLPWLADEVGETGVAVLRAVKAELDPAGVLNPGVLVP